MFNNDNKILACIDGSKYSQSVCDYAAWISQRTGAPLQLLHNLEHPVGASTADLSGAIGLGSRDTLLQELTEVEEQRNRLMMEQGKLMLAAAKERIGQGGTEASTKQRHGSLTESLIEMEDDIRVLVLGIRGEEHEQDTTHLGAHLEATIRALHRPILVVNTEFRVPEKVMLAYDGSDASSKALDMLAQSPLFKGIPVHLVTVGEDPADSNTLQHKATEVLQAAGHNVTAVTLDGKPSETLVSYQAEHDIDLTLMGAFSHTRLRELVLGSLTAKVLLKSNKPLLLLR
ncbi:universal stress protein [Saccharospirillum alexandrii]|uniref:universal stress protein n=1 Tax=Saccharospirillum alexandrii TaxID=2448477 RepID=UPI000FD6E7E4|nr:universal stress protein [Saccharospirillum alexandrii]